MLFLCLFMFSPSIKLLMLSNIATWHNIVAWKIILNFKAQACITFDILIIISGLINCESSNISGSNIIHYMHEKNVKLHVCKKGVNFFFSFFSDTGFNSLRAEMNTFSHVPPGFRFHPTDEELVGYYLRKKVASKRIDLDVIKDVDLYKIEPWDLQGNSS